MKKLVELVHPKHEARGVAFFSFGDGQYGGAYYETLTVENLFKAECLFATQMNGQPSPMGMVLQFGCASRTNLVTRW